MWGNELSHSKVSSHFGNWNPNGLLNLQRAISGVKTNLIEEFFIPQKSFWNIDVLKWVRMTHLGTQNISYGQKKGQESSCQFDSRPLKVRNLHDLLTFMCLCHIMLERSWWRLQLFFRPHLNQRFSQKIMGLQSCKIPHFKNFETLNLGAPKQNDIWVQAPWSSTENTIRGKAMASLKSSLWWVLKVRVCPWLIRAPKVLQLLH